MINFELIEGNSYFVKLNTISSEYNSNNYRIAKFNGFGKGWANTDWAGDSGHSTDSWMHDEVDSFVPLDQISEILNIGILSKPF